MPPPQIEIDDVRWHLCDPYLCEEGAAIIRRMALKHIGRHFPSERICSHSSKSRCKCKRVFEFHLSDASFDLLIMGFQPLP